MAVLRAVLDANVFVISLINPKGVPAEMFREFIERQSFDLVTSGQILDEVRRALEYPRVKKRLKSSPEEIEEYQMSLEILSTCVNGTVSVESIPADPSDEKYIAAAIEGLASHIVSGDRHMLGRNMKFGMAIITPRRFLELL